MVVLVAGLSVSLPPAYAATTTTVVQLSCTNDVATFPGDITLTVSVPDSVHQSGAVGFDVTSSDFFKIPAPYSGTITVRERFLASAGAAPSGPFELSTPTTSFKAGDFSTVVATLHAQFLASGTPGSTIDFSFLEFGYTLTSEAAPGATFVTTCTPVPAAPLVGSTVITQSVPYTKAECKRGGWLRLVNANGEPFRNQGECVSFVEHNRHTK